MKKQGRAFGSGLGARAALWVSVTVALAGCAMFEKDVETSSVTGLGTPGVAFVPVQTGGEVDMDACGALGEIHGLQSDSLSVRQGPGTNYRRIDSLVNGTTVSLCDGQGEWSGIVYQRPGDPRADCGTASPQAGRNAYPGPCRSGWVHSNWVRLVAG